ncbi:MAG TPA: threonine synthase [Firmicutes bacterium]|nr:threonine synthase [Bacillota bacterium]
MEQLLYKSTRGEEGGVSAATAILQGIAPDGGLFVPTVIPPAPWPLTELAQLSYQELACRIMSLYFTCFSREEIAVAVNKAYDSKFAAREIAPLVTHNNMHFLELFHGPTLAFKDMALAILPHLLKLAAEKAGVRKEIVILTATSGDTGKAALEGFAGVAGTRIIVFFPQHGVSEVQKRQMVTQTGDNTHVIGIEGNFDDAQNGVKAMFTDESLRRRLDSHGYLFSSANSINIGRLVPQIVYYYWAYLQLVRRDVIAAGDAVNMVVPTGNFGNILAAWYARSMGLPLARLLCASNSNKVLFDFFATGVYDRKRQFFVTMSPSMDILISSNLERLLYHAAGEDSSLVRSWMEDLAHKGVYTLPPEVSKGLTAFAAGYATEEETAAAIRGLFAASGYLVDPHTAVAVSVLEKYRKESGDGLPAVVISTASPYKFPQAVLTAINKQFAGKDDFALFGELEKITGIPVPPAAAGLERRPVLHTSVCGKHEMQQVVENILSLAKK